MSHSVKVYPDTQNRNNDWPIIIYDQSRHKSAQSLLYQAARAKDEEAARKLWKKFLDQLTIERLSAEQTKVLIQNLDDRKQWAPIHYAVECNNLYIFCQLTTNDSRFRCDINLNTGNGENVLHIAAKSNQIWSEKPHQRLKGIPEILVQSTVYHSGLLIGSELPLMVHRTLNLGADVNDQDDEGHTPLHLAVANNRYNYAKALIERGANLSAITKMKASVLYFALLSNDVTSSELCQMIKLILDHTNSTEAKSHLLDVVTVDNQTSLARALSHPAATKELVQKLIDKGVQMDERQLLIAFDMLARHHHSSKDFFTCLRLVLDQYQIQSYQAVLYQILHIVVRHDNQVLLEWLVEYIKELPMKDQQLKIERRNDHGGYTVLLTAIFYNAKKCVRYLLRQEEAVTDHQQLLDTNDNNENILHICAKRHVDEELFEIIWQKLFHTSMYRYKDDLIRMIDAEGKLPIEIAACFDVHYICRKLLEDVKNELANSNSLLIKGKVAHQASKAGHLNILKLVLDDDAKGGSQKKFSNDMLDILRKRNEDQYTCLHLAAQSNHKEIVEFLLNKAKVEVDPIGARRATPLHLACENGHLEIVRLLLKAGASTTFRNAQVYNCLEIAITNQRKTIVEELFQQPLWREMMRNAQPIEGTEAFDTPMRKLIRYMPEMAIWLIDNRLTRVVGGPGQKMYTTNYDYEFYEDFYTVKDWYTQGTTLQSERKTCAKLWTYRGIEAIHTCWCCCHSDGDGCLGCCCRAEQNDEENRGEWYTNDAYTLVRNHPLFVVSQQKHCPALKQHDYHTYLRQEKLRSFGLWIFILSFFLYIAYLALYTVIILRGKHPKYFYDHVNISMTVDLSTCERVSNLILSHTDIRNEALKTETYKRIKWTLYAILYVFIGKSLIMILALFPKVFRTGGYYIEISALVLSAVYNLDWYSWQNDILFRCPVQYQIGAMGILLAYINLLLYLRTSPVFDVGIYVVMLQVISAKFLRFLPILLVIICGFGFTYWMLLQYQTVYGTPIEALLRTSLMLFDLGYDDRLYNEHNGGIGYYTLIYVIFMLTAIACSIFVINLLIGLAVGEIPTLLTQGTLWRTDILFNLLSDYEILRLRLILAFDCITCRRFRHRRQILKFSPRPYSILEKNELQSPMGRLGNLWKYAVKHFFNEQIQDSINPSKKFIENKQ